MGQDPGIQYPRHERRDGEDATAGDRWGRPLRLNLHEPRHAFASIMVNEWGVPWAVVRGMLGHESLRMTMDLHGHLGAAPASGRTPPRTDRAW